MIPNKLYNLLLIHRLYIYCLILFYHLSSLKDEDGNILSTGYLDQRVGAQIVNTGSYAVARLNPGENILTDAVLLNIPSTAPYSVMLEAVIDNTYYHYNKPDQVTAPGMNQSLHSTISETAYRAYAAPEYDFYAKAQPVIISGQAISNTTNTPMAYVPVKVGVSVNGFDRFYPVSSDASGNFSFSFVPGANEAGLYSVWAVHPDVKDRSVQSSFVIAGLSMTPEYATVRMVRNRTIEIPISLYNYGGGQLAGLLLETRASPGITATVVNTGDSTLAVKERTNLVLRITASSSAADTGYTTLIARTAEGVATRFDASLSIVSAIPIINTTPSLIDTGMVRGNQKIETFTIKNVGEETLRNARIEGPSTPWMTLTVNKALGDILPGASVPVGVILNPSETLAQGVYDDTLVIYSDNHIPYTYHVQVTITSSAVGSVLFDVLNELMEDVSGATITLQNQLLTELMYTKKTLADGTVMVYDIPEGRYSYNISAPGHKSSSGSFVVYPGMTTTVPIAMEVTLVQVEWSVTPIVIQDRYEIKITTTFETNVPTPVLVIETGANTYSFNPQGRLQSIKDLRGNTVTLTYDTTGNLTTMSDIMGRQIYTITYNSANRISRITDLASRTVTYDYDGTGNLIKVSAPITPNSTAVTLHTYTYNTYHGLTTKTNAISETYTIEYYPAWQDKGITKRIINPVGTELIRNGQQPAGQETSFIYDFGNKVFYYTDYRGATYKNVVNENGQVLSVEEMKDGQAVLLNKTEYLANRTVKTTDALGNVTITQKDEWGNVIKRTDPVGNTWRYTYNSQNRLLSSTDPLGTITAYEYDQYGNRTKETVASGTAEESITTYTYNQYNELTATTNNSAVTTYSYNQQGLVTFITDQRGNVTLIEYNAIGNPTKITDSLGNVTTATYDLSGNALTITDPNGKITTNTYNAKGNLLATTDPLGNITIFAYNYSNKLTAKTDAEGKTTTYEYDGTKRLTKITDAAGGITTFGYSTACSSCGSGGDVSSLTDPKGQTTGYTYDKGLMVKETNPLGKYRTYIYNKNKQIAGIVDYMGRMTTFGYDAAGMLTSKITADDTITYTYDRLGRMTSAKNANSDLVFTYDAKGNLTSEKDKTRNTQISYTYDNYGNRTAMTGPVGTVTYAYNGYNRLSSITNPNGKVTIYTMDTLSRRTKEELPNGLTATYTYDDLSRLSTLLTQTTTQQTVDTFGYTYDKVGNRTAITTITGSNAYAYNNLYQLVSATHPDQASESYQYDPVGNRNPQTYRHSAWNQILEDDQFTYTYDDNGNRTSSTAKDGNLKDMYTWNAENKLDKFERFDNPTAPVAITTAIYTYDALERRSGKDVNGTITGYIYDGMHIIAEVNGQGAVTTSYVHGDGIDEPVSITRSNATYYYHRDAIGSITQITDAAGAVVQQYRYDSFGNIVYTSNPSFIQPITFTGRDYDSESGLYYYRARQYDANTGMFISEDPIGFDGGSINLYEYVHSNPVKNTDPLGLAIWICNRKTKAGIGNHAYLYNDRDKSCCGRDSTKNCTEKGPFGKDRDSCRKIADSNGKEDQVMQCCRNTGDSGAWRPPVNDCHTAAGDCIEWNGLKNPGAPGGRVGKPCDPCPK